MTIAEDVLEHTPTTEFDEKSALYWIDGKTVMFRGYPIRGADAESFRFFARYFAKDKNHCYLGSSRIKGANASTFHALNLTFMSDDERIVVTMGGIIPDVDAASFAVCDDGVYCHSNHRYAYGFGKDQFKVYYYDSDGKPNWVKKADSASFKSLNDGHFGMDERHVFYGYASIAKADVNTWGKIGGFNSYYSKDKSRIFYFNRNMTHADLATFEVLSCGPNKTQLARDCNHFYWNDNIIDENKFYQLLNKEKNRSDKI